jgi:hypothetical protein
VGNASYAGCDESPLNEPLPVVPRAAQFKLAPTLLLDQRSPLGARR